MAQIYAITNQKGGVGKTTTAIHLAAALSLAQRRILLVDLDPQGNASTGSGLERGWKGTGSSALLSGESSPQELIVRAKAGGYDLLPADAELTATEVDLLQDPVGRERRLQEGLQSISENYDYILVDCPPALNVLTLNAMLAANGLLVPVQCEYYALEGLSTLMQTVADLDAQNPNLRNMAIVRTLYAHNRLAAEVSAELQHHFGARLYRTVIPRNVRLAEAPSHGTSVLSYDRYCTGGRAYMSMAQEFLQRAEENPPNFYPLTAQMPAGDT